MAAGARMPMARRARPLRLLGCLLALYCLPPASAAAQVTSTNPFAPFPQTSTPTAAQPTLPTPLTTTNASSGANLGAGAAIVIGVGALVVLGGISFFIWHDARRRAPVRSRAATATAGGRPGSKPRDKPRKLSPAERRRRKRGRAR
ncbi:MAG: hypothetical protein M3018_11335 [Actinomycetota bacterium]|nr:hypothetical protein [Actinomycetota bacterium]